MTDANQFASAAMDITLVGMTAGVASKMLGGASKSKDKIFGGKSSHSKAKWW